MENISAIYKITNTITGDFYIGSSKNVKNRLASHKRTSTWNKCPNNPMYQDMQKYGTDKFDFQILEEVEIEHLKEVEQQFIEKLQPTYNSNRANGWDIEKRKERDKKYRQSEKGKEYQKKYRQSEKGKERKKEYNNEYKNQLCLYNSETLTLNALYQRFRSQGINHPTAEAKKYLIGRLQ